jgi:hypothetical protein
MMMQRVISAEDEKVIGKEESALSFRSPSQCLRELEQLKNYGLITRRNIKSSEGRFWENFGTYNLRSASHILRESSTYHHTWILNGVLGY